MVFVTTLTHIFFLGFLLIPFGWIDASWQTIIKNSIDIYLLKTNNHFNVHFVDSMASYSSSTEQLWVVSFSSTSRHQPFSISVLVFQEKLNQNFGTSTPIAVRFQLVSIVLLFTSFKYLSNTKWQHIIPRMLRVKGRDDGDIPIVDNETFVRIEIKQKIP